MAPDWLQVTASARSVQAGVARLRAALLNCAAGHPNPAMEEAAAALAVILGEHHAQLQLASQFPDTLPAELKLELQQLGADIQLLAEWNTRLAASGQRTLALLLPEASGQGYARLGGNRASPFAANASGSGYLKA